MFDSTNWQDVAVRAAKTFWQAFVAAFVLPVVALDVSAWKAAAAAAGAAGLSAVWNFLYGWWQRR